MKNKMLAILIACLLLINSTPVFANTNYLVDSENLEEIKAREEYIVDDFNNALPTGEIKSVESKDIDYEKIIKVYPNMRKILEDNDLDNEKMQKYIKDAKYSYYIPIYDNGKTALATVSERTELTNEAREKFTQEEIDNYELLVGKLVVKSVGVYSEIVDYKGEIEKTLIDNNIENATVYFVGALSNRIGLAAVICTDNPADTQIKILKQFESKVEENDSVTFDDNKLYTFYELKTITEREKKDILNSSEEYIGYGDSAPTSLTSATDNNKIIIASSVSGVAVLAIVVAAICIVKKKKAAKVLGENDIKGC